MLIQLGSFPFELKTAAYNTLTRRSQAIWARLPILGNNERLQAVGRANDTITLIGTVYPEHAVLHGGRGGTRILDGLRNYLKALQPRHITSADGKSWGYWAIESLANQDSRFMRDGTPRKQDFQITLRYYGKSYP